MSLFLNQRVLVLNRLWQAVNICTARRALTLLFEGHAQVVLNAGDGSFQTYNFSEWRDFSRQDPHPESVCTVSFRIRVPRVILLIVFDRLPKKEVKFSRATAAARPPGKTSFAPAFRATRKRPIALPRKPACG